MSTVSLYIVIYCPQVFVLLCHFFHSTFKKSDLIFLKSQIKNFGRLSDFIATVSVFFYVLTPFVNEVHLFFWQY